MNILPLLAAGCRDPNAAVLMGGAGDAAPPPNPPPKAAAPGDGPRVGGGCVPRLYTPAPTAGEDARFVPPVPPAAAPNPPPKPPKADGVGAARPTPPVVADPGAGPRRTEIPPAGADAGSPNENGGAACEEAPAAAVDNPGAAAPKRGVDAGAPVAGVPAAAGAEVPPNTNDVGVAEAGAVAGAAPKVNAATGLGAATPACVLLAAVLVAGAALNVKVEAPGAATGVGGAGAFDPIEAKGKPDVAAGAVAVSEPEGVVSAVVDPHAAAGEAPTVAAVGGEVAAAPNRKATGFEAAGAIGAAEAAVVSDAGASDPASPVPADEVPNVGAVDVVGVCVAAAAPAPKANAAIAEAGAAAAVLVVDCVPAELKLKAGAGTAGGTVGAGAAASTAVVTEKPNAG